jgi:hypothetical protein
VAHTAACHAFRPVSKVCRTTSPHGMQRSLVELYEPIVPEVFRQGKEKSRLYYKGPSSIEIIFVRVLPQEIKKNISFVCTSFALCSWAFH